MTIEEEALDIIEILKEQFIYPESPGDVLIALNWRQVEVLERALKS